MLNINLTRKQGDFIVRVNFQAECSGVTALFGQSGAGKTSVINMIAGLSRPDKGHISINKRCLFDSEKGIDIAMEKRRIGYVFQEGRLFPHMTVMSNLVYGMKRVPVSERYVQLDPVVDLLGIGHLLSRKPGGLSGGEKQRVAIGRALLTSPQLLLMDEPLAALDAARKCEVLPFIARLTREFDVPSLYVSHAMDEIRNLAGRMVIFEDGQVVATGSVEEISQRFLCTVPDRRKKTASDSCPAISEAEKTDYLPRAKHRLS